MDRVTGDPIEAAYFGVGMGQGAAGTTDVDAVREMVYAIHLWLKNVFGKCATNQHTYKPVYVGEIRKDGFDIVGKLMV